MLILLAYRLFGKTGLFVWIGLSVIVANIQVVKTVEIFGLTATLGNIVYASSFLVTDILNENCGPKEAKTGVYLGFFCLICMLLLMNLALLFQPAPSDFTHDSLITIFSLIPRIAVASLVAYFISQAHDVWSYQLWKKKLPSRRYLWVRNNASTLVSQLIDSVIFTVIAFAGVYPSAVLLEILFTTYILKLIVAVVDTPFLYLASRWKDKKTVI